MSTSHPLSHRSIESIRDSIAEIESIDLREHKADDLVPMVGAACEGYTWMTKRIKMRAAYRARRLEIPPERLSELWYPPRTAVKTIGRANDISESVMYASDSEDTATLEMRPSSGESLAILQMTLADPAVLPHVFDVALAETAGKHDPKIGATEFHRTKLGRNLLGSDENIQKLDLIRSFMVRQFTRVVRPGHEHDYVLALAIAKFNHHRSKDGIWYPSIAGGNIGTNVALRADAADRLLRPWACWMIRIEEALPGNEFKVRCTRKASEIDGDGTIHWKS